MLVKVDAARHVAGLFGSLADAFGRTSLMPLSAD
jgi:hypothetical protein